MAEILFYACIPLAIAAAVVAAVWARQRLHGQPLAGSARRLVLYRVPLLLAGLCMLLGLAAAVVYANAARQAAYADAQTHFLHEAEQLEADVQSQIRELDHLLNGVRGLFLARANVSHLELKRFVDARDLHQEYPGFRGLGFIERVQRPALATFVTRMQREAGTTLPLQTRGHPAELFVVTYLEPASRSELAIGYDIGSEPVRRAAAEAAMYSGQAALTSRIRLVQDPLQRAAFLYLLPVYRTSHVPDGPAERVRDLRGWVYASVVFSELMAAGHGFDTELSNFQLFDQPELSAQSLVYDSQLPAGDVRSPASLLRQTHSMFSVVRPILLADQVFYLRTNASPAFDASHHSREHLKAALLGSGLSVLAAMVLWLLMAGRARAVDMAQRMTHDLERLAMVAKRTSNAVYFADTEWHITWINEGFTRMCGFSAQEALGMRPSQLLHSPLADPATAETIDHKVAQDNRVQIQVLQRSKSGQDYWVDLEVMPIRDSQGRVTGYLSVQSDITEEVQAKAALVREKERAQTVLSGTNVGTWESNLQSGEQSWNDRWSAMMGFAREDVRPNLGDFLRQRLHPADQPRLRQAMVDCVTGRCDNMSCELRVQRKDGSWMWILSRAKVMSRSQNGRAEWIGGIHTDITELKQVELSLRDMEAFLDRAGRIAGVGAWQMDLITRELVFSAQTCAIHGLAPDFKPTEELALSFYPEPDRQRVRDALQRVGRDGTSWDLVVELHNAQGQQLWVRIFCEVGFDDSGPVRLMGAFQDVTKDHMSQLEVERSGALLRGAIEAIDEAFVLFDPQDRLVFCNDKYRAIYDKSADLMVHGATFESVIRGGAARGQYADAQGRVEEWVQERMAAHRLGHVATEQRLADGRWLKVIEQRMPDGHMVGFRVDITELKLATAAAELTSAQRGGEQRRMQNILEGTRVGTWEHNLQTSESIYNEQYVGMLGYTLQELEPTGYDTWVRLVHPDDLVACNLLMEEHLRDDSVVYEIEVRMLHKQGHWIWVLAKGKLAQRLHDGSPLWVYGTHMDITERKRAAQQLAQTTAMLQNVLDSATAVGVMTMGLDQGIRVFNKGAENLLGFKAEEMVEQHSASVFFDHSELGALRETLAPVLGHQPELQEVFSQVVQTRDEQEWTLVRKNGTRFKASLIFSPMRDAQGALDGHLAVIYDISKQKEYESSLREAMRLAEQSSVAKGQFLANMSHEIRTPMNAILGMLQLLRNTALSPTQNDYADKAVGAARSLLGLLNDILDFSKVDAGKMQLNPEPFFVDDLLGDLSVILSSNLGSKAVDLVFDVDPSIPGELIGDAMRLKQILINLGGNAVKFTDQGEVVIRLSLLARSQEGVKLAVAVADTGIGIAPENQARIFDAFTQAEANTTRRFGGTGLGLVISKRLIRLMGGELQLSSALGQGSTFSFTLQLRTADFVPDALPDAFAVMAPVLRILLVDDNPHALATSAAMVHTLGWQVAQAGSGAAALDYLQANLAAQAAPVDAVYVDADMPGMDGWETLRNVRRLYGTGKSPLLILMSRQSRDALAQRTDREQALFNGLMVKPLTRPMFAKALEQARSGSGGAAAHTKTSPKRLQGMRILLVEDNPINQQVAQELLQAQGASVTLAHNGALGLAALREAQPAFHVVLMDLQMPVMDGLSATRLLRADPRFADLPVIAMTANAMHSDREECLAAGTNDHVGKPFDLNQLVQTLISHTHWVVRPAATAAAQGAASVDGPAASPAAPQSWPEGLEVELALSRMGGDRQLLQRTITAYVVDARRLPQRLQQGLQQGDLEQVRRDLHSVKGLSATIGASVLSELAARAEKLLQAPAGIADAQQALARFIQQLATELPALQAVAGRLQSGVAVPPPGLRNGALTQGALELLRNLLLALQSSDMLAMELYARLRQELGPVAAQAVESLDLAMAELKFAVAASECEKLMQQFDTCADPLIP